MSSKQEITKEELFERVPTNRLCTSQEIVLATARALGFTVTEEPALPERIRINEDGGIEDADTAVIVWGNKGADWARLKVELVRRYNAKAAVLAVVAEIWKRASYGRNCMHPDAQPVKMLTRWAETIRAAYEAPAP